MRRLALALSLCLLVPFAAPALAQTPAPASTALRTVIVKAPNETLTLEIADTFQIRAYGLMNRTAVAHATGMLFVFKTEGPQNFWMKNTLVPLDMVFVHADGTVESIAANVPASTLKTADEDVAQRAGVGKYVIELAAGEARSAGLRPGVKLVLPKLSPQS